MYKWMTGILCAGCVLLQAGSEKILHIDFEKPLAKKDVTGRIALKLQGTPETVPGVVGSALFFNGNKQALRSSSKALRFSENESFTVEFYIKPERNPGKYWPNPVYVSGLRFAGRPHINSPFLFMSDGKKRLIVTGTGTGRRKANDLFLHCITVSIDLGVGGFPVRMHVFKTGVEGHLEPIGISFKFLAIGVGHIGEGEALAFIEAKPKESSFIHVVPW